MTCVICCVKFYGKKTQLNLYHSSIEVQKFRAIFSCCLFPVRINKNYKTVVRMQLDPARVDKPIYKAGPTLGRRNCPDQYRSRFNFRIYSFKNNATCYSCSQVETYFLMRMRGWQLTSVKRAAKLWSSWYTWHISIMATSVEDKSSNFLRQFRDLKTREFKLLSAQQFMEVWNHYDTDGKGLKNFSFFNFPVDTIL